MKYFKYVILYETKGWEKKIHVAKEGEIFEACGDRLY